MKGLLTYSLAVMLLHQTNYTYADKTSAATILDAIRHPTNDKVLTNATGLCDKNEDYK